MNGNEWFQPALVGILGIALLACIGRNALKRPGREKSQSENTLKALPDAVIRLDMEGRPSYLNPSAEALLGLLADRGGDTKAWSLIDHETRSPLLETILAEAGKIGATKVPANARLIERHGLELEVEGICQTLPGRDGGIDGYLLQLRDVTEEREWHRQQPDLWDRDPVSTLPGRHFMEYRLDRALQNKRAGDLPMTYLSISLTGIREVYDRAGGLAGDTLVRYLTAVLRTHVRDTDLLARMAEEEFAVLLTYCPAEVGRRIAERTLAGLNSFSFEWEGRKHPIEVGLGQIDTPPFEGGLDELLAAARRR